MAPVGVGSGSGRSETADGQAPPAAKTQQSLQSACWTCRLIRDNISSISSLADEELWEDVHDVMGAGHETTATTAAAAIYAGASSCWVGALCMLGPSAPKRSQHSDESLEASWGQQSPAAESDPHLVTLRPCH